MEENLPSGTYAAVHFDEQTITKLQQFIKDNNIPNGVAPNKMHCTLLYSTKYLPNYKPLGDINPPLVGTPTKLERWAGQPDGDEKVSMCLVLKFDCPGLNVRHNTLMESHDATFGFDEYITHITLSYDVGDIQVKDLTDINQIVDKISITYEYGDDLDLNWAKSSLST